MIKPIGSLHSESKSPRLKFDCTVHNFIPFQYNFLSHFDRTTHKILNTILCFDDFILNKIYRWNQLIFLLW